MIDVVLDTTVFRSDPERGSPLWKALERLAEIGQVRIYVANVSEREFITYCEKEYNDLLAALRQWSRKLRSYVGRNAQRTIKLNHAAIPRR